jgi:hypothetical protein
MASDAVLALDRLVPAGSVRLEACHVHAQASNAAVTAADGWSAFARGALVASGVPAGARRSASSRLLEDLELLAKLAFLRATYMPVATSDVVLVRVYLVPVDLPGLQSKCLSSAAKADRHKRAAACRRALAEVLAVTSTSPEQWGGDPSPAGDARVLDGAEVSGSSHAPRLD